MFSARLILLLSFSTLAFALLGQDLIVKTNGDELVGKIVRITPNEVTYKKADNLEGPEYVEPKSGILFVKFENGKKEVFVNIVPINQTPSSDISTLCAPLKRKNSVFFEAAGNGLIASLNYERKIFSSKNNNFVALKAGLGPFGIINLANVTATYNLGDGMNYFEVGGGFGYFSTDDSYGFGSEVDYNYAYFTPTLGFRRQGAKGFLFRMFLTMYTSKEVRVQSQYQGVGGNTFSNIYYGNIYSYEYNYYPSMGLSLGYSF